MHKPDSKRILFDRFAAILAILAAASYDYGLRIWMLAGIAAAVSLLSECFCLFIRKRKLTADVLESPVTGLILLLLMPPSVPVSLLIMSCIFTIIIGRVLFGGKENPVIPPAAAGFCFCLLNSRSQTVSFPVSKESLPLLHIDPASLTDGVSALWNRSGRFSVSAMEWLTGLPRQPIGSGSIILIAVIALVLILRRAASGWVIVPALAAVIVSNLSISNLQHPFSVVIGSCMTNQFLIALIFLHADPDHAPPVLAGIAYGFAVGFTVFYATRVMYIYDAPVLLAVLFSPLMIWLRRMMIFEEELPETADGRRASA